MKKIITILTVLTASLTATAQNDKEIKFHDELSNKEEVVTCPESMTMKTDELLQQWMGKHCLFPDDANKKDSVATTSTPEQIQERLRRLPTAIEMPYNNLVKECIDKYTSELQTSVAYMLGAGNFYIPLIEETLDRYGLPLELKYLPVVESSLNPTMVSSNGAKGLWRLPLAIAQRYNLEINTLVDERFDPYKSTTAAIQYLKDLYHIYDDWNLVIAAFNCAPNSVNKTIHRADGQKNYWAIYTGLPKDIRGYVPSFIAANYIMNYYCEHGIRPMKTKFPAQTDTVVVTRNLHMKQIATLCDIDIETIKALNPQYCAEVIPGASKPRVLRMPQKNILKFIDLKDSIYNYQAEKLLTRKAVTATDTKEVAKVKEASRAKYVTVRRGDTLGAIARRNHTTVSKIKRLNGMRSDRIKPGKRLRVK